MSIMRMSMGQKASAKNISKVAFAESRASTQSNYSRSSAKPSVVEPETDIERLNERIEKLADPPKHETVFQSRFNMAMGALIILNIFLIAVETDVADEDADLEGRIGWVIIDSIFILIFMVEIAVRIYWERKRWFYSGWNWADLTIVFIAMLDVWVITMVDGKGGSLHVLSVLRIIRLVRLIRLVKLVRLLHGLYVILMAFWHAMQTMAMLLAMMLFGMMIYSIFAVTLIGRNSALRDVDINGDTVYDRFGTVYRSMYSLFELMTLEGWEAVCRPIVEKQPWLFIFIASFIMIFTFGMLNMIVALVIEKTLHHTRMMSEHTLQAQREQLMEELMRVKTLFSRSNSASDGQITFEEFEQALRDSETVAAMFKNMGIALTDAKELYAVLDYDESGDLSLKEFLEGLQKLQDGVPTAWDSLATHALARNLKRNVGELHERFHTAQARNMAWQTSMEARLDAQGELLQAVLNKLNSLSVQRPFERAMASSWG